MTIWQLQSDNSYRYIYDTGTVDDPQPVPQPREELPEDAIVVPGLTALEGRIADCPRQGEPYPQIPLAMIASAQSDGGDSADGSFSWHRYYMADGRRQVRVVWVRDGAAQEAVSLIIPAGQ